MALGRDFRLPRDVRPLRYELRFDLDLDRWTFEGVETIRIVLDQARRDQHAPRREFRGSDIAR